MKCNEIQVTTYYHQPAPLKNDMKEQYKRPWQKLDYFWAFPDKDKSWNQLLVSTQKWTKWKAGPYASCFIIIIIIENTRSRICPVCLESDLGSDLPSLYTAAQTIAIISETLFVPCHYSSDQVYIYTHYRCLVRYISSWVCWSFDIKIVYWLTFLVLFPGKFPVQLDCGYGKSV